MPDNHLKELYNTLVKDNYEMPKYEDFAKDMRDLNKLQDLYKHISGDYELPDFDTFAMDMTGGLAEAEVAAEPAKKKDYVSRPEGYTYPWENTPTPGAASPSASTPSPQETAPTLESAIAGNPRNLRQEAIDFIQQDYIQNRPDIDRALTSSDKNPFGTSTAPKNFMDKGPLVDLVSPDGNFDNLRKYTQSRLAKIDLEYKQRQQDIENRYPETVDNQASFLGLPVSKSRSNEKSYKEELEQARLQYDETRKKLLAASSVLGDMKNLSEQVKKASPEALDNGTFLNLREMGRKSLRLFSNPTESNNMDEEVSKQERFERQGIPLTPEQKASTDRAGLEAAQNAIREMIQEATKNGGPIPPSLQKQALAVQQAAKNFWADHDDYRREQVIDALSNEIAKAKGGVHMIGDFGVTDQDIKDAAKKLGLDDRYIGDIKTGDIKQQNIIGSALEGFIGTVGKMGSFATSGIRKELGQSPDWIEYAESENLKKFSNLGGALGENPTVQGLFNPEQEVQTDPNASNFLFNKPADPTKAGKFSWNAAGILNSVAGATGQLAAYAATGSAGGALGLGHDASMMAGLYASSYNDNYNAAKEMGIKDDNKAEAYASIRSLTNAFIFTKLLPTEKIADELLSPANAAGKSLFEFIDQKGLDGITKEALQPVLKRAIGEGLKDMGKVLGAAELDKAADFVTAAAIDPHSLDHRDFLKESAKEGLSLALATVLPSALGAARKGQQMSGLYKNMIWDMGTKPEEYIQSVYKSWRDGNITREQAENNMRTIGKMTKAVNATPDYSMLSEKNLTEKQKAEYASNLVRDGVLKEQLERFKDDPAQTPAIESELKNLQKQRENILKNAGGEGEISVSDAERPVRGGLGAEQPRPQEPTVAEPAPGPGPKPAPAGEARPVPEGEHPVMTPQEFRGLKVGDQIHMETPAGKVVQDEVSKVAGGEVTLKNTGVVRNQTVTDPGNVGYRFVKPAEKTNAPVEGAPAPKTSVIGENTPVVEEAPKVGKPKGFFNAVDTEVRSAARADSTFTLNEDGTVDLNPDHENRAMGAVSGYIEPLYEMQDYPGGRDSKYNKPIVLEKPIAQVGKDGRLEVVKKGKISFDQQAADEYLTKKQGGQNAIHEQSAMEGVLREEGRPVELPQVGEGDTGGLQKPAEQTTQAGTQPQAVRSRESFETLTPEQEKDLRMKSNENPIQLGIRKNNVNPLVEIRSVQGPSGKWYASHGVLVGNGGFSGPVSFTKQHAFDTKDAAVAAEAKRALERLNNFEKTNEPPKSELPLIKKAREGLQNLIDQHEATTTGGRGAESAAQGTTVNRGRQGNAKNVRDETTAMPGEGAGQSGAKEGNTGQAETAQGERKQSNADAEKEKEIRDRLKEKKKAFFDALKKSRGQLNVGIDPEVIARGIDMLATYAELGIHKFSRIAREMIQEFGKDFTKEDIDALRGVYGYHREVGTPEQRARMEPLESIDKFYAEELPGLLNPAPFHPLEIKLGKENRPFKFIGTNSEGHPIYEDAKGVRTKPGDTGSSIYVTEPVSIAPTRTGVESWIENRRDEYKTTEELAATKPLEAEIVSQADGETNFIQRVKDAIDSDNRLTIVHLRKIAGELGLEQKDTYLQELAETAVVEIARDIVSLPISDLSKYQQIQTLYERQPSFNMRSSERVDKQQYSTPAPISFTAGMYVGHNNPDLILEPSAGNGLLTIYFPPGKVHANEIDPVRLANLHRAGYGVVTSQNGTLPFKRGEYGGVITNPPFGSAPERVYDGYRIKGLDEQMIINALDSMSDSGRAALIMGGHMSYDDKGRLKADRTFFNYLHNHYNVADVININGDLYAKQGTKFPIRLILIDGRKETPNGAAPLRSEADDVVNSFQDLYDRVQRVKNIDYGSILQSELDVRPGQGNPLYGADAQAALDKIGTDTTPGSAPAAASPASGENGGRSDAPDRGQTSAGPKPPGGRSGTGSGNTAVRPNEIVDKPISPREPGPSTSTQGGNRASDTTGGGGPISGDDTQRVPTNFDANRIAAEKVPYIPASRSASLESVVPTQMASEIERVLTQLNKEVGGVDEFVRSELGYPDTDSLFKVLKAEQVDAVAMAIKQLQKGQGMIIGDQTGVGKGRIGASLIRWAVRNGGKPIFLTEKPNLFSDLYRDLVAIGSGDLVPFIVNDKSSDSDPKITDEDENVLYLPQPKGVKKRVFETGELPADVGVVISTYSQFSKSEETTKKAFLRKVAEGNIIIADESHNMSGDSNTGIFFRDILASSAGTAYLSATFAKRPDNMPIYAVKTAMSEANMTHDDLVAAIERGGVALQEVVSAELAEAGQMLRRERDFTGVHIEYNVLDHKLDEYTKRMDNVTGILRDIIAFQADHITPLIEGMDAEAKAEGAVAGERKGTKMAGVDNTDFASKIFQVVHQLLFAMKADDVAEEAIKELRANRKPVIGFNSTMESFLDYAGLQPGDKIGKADFSLSLLRGLEGTMRYTVKDARGNSNPKSFSLADLSEEGRNMYQAVRSRIQSASTGVPISPLDAIIKKIEDAGYSVKEITGRSLYIEYDDQGGGTVKARTDKDKNKVTRAFNGGRLDVAMINASGATGISMQASKDFKDQRQRTLISGQLELDVNLEMQKRGRIDRTGQVVRGRFNYVVSAIPAEKRLLMMFQSKLKSLDANTTSSQKQKTSEVSVIVDFLNKHGDQVVLEYLANNPIMNLALRDPLKLLERTEEDVAELKPKGGEAKKVTGRVALLRTDQQEQFYKDVIDQYQAHIEMLESIGQNDLEVKKVPLAARTISSQVVIQGKGGTSPFARDTMLEKVEANVIRKPITGAELQKEIERSLGGKAPHEIAEQLSDEAGEYLDNYIEQQIEELRQEYQQKRENAHDFIAKKVAKLKNEPTDEERRDMLQQHYQDIEQGLAAAIDRTTRKEGNNRDLILARLNFFKVGSPYGVPTSLNADVSSAYVPGIFLGFKIGSGTENRYRPSNISLRFATPMGSLRVVQVPLSRRAYIDAVVSNTVMTPRSEWAGLVENWDNRTSRSDRQTRYIVTGNILQGFNYAPGQLVSYTTEDGQIRKGVLLSEDWKPEKDAVTRIPIGKGLEHLKKTGELASSNGEVKIERASAGYLISVPASKKSGGKYYLHQGLRALVSGNDFRQSGGRFMAQFSASKVEDVLSILQNEFGLAINVPQLNLKTDVLPKELQTAHDAIAYGGDQPKLDRLQEAARAVAHETAGLEASQASALEGQNLTDVLPRTFAQDFTERAVTSHAGYEIKGPKDVADLFALYRSPFIEKSHLIFVKDGVIVANHSITSNSPTETPVWHATEVANLASGYGADEVFLVHNHPSGNPEPSELDTYVTAHYGQMLPQYGIKFRGQVILNGNRFALLDARGKHTMEQYSTPQPALFSPRYRFSADPAKFQEQAVDVAHYILKDNQGQMGIVYVDPDNKVSGYDLIAPNASIEDIVDTIRSGMLPNGASNYYIASQDPHPDLMAATLPYGMIGEISLNGGVRGGAEFQTEPLSSSPNENTLQARRNTNTIPTTPPGGPTGATPPFQVEVEKTSRVKSFGKRTKQNLAEAFLVGGGIDKALRDLKEQEIGNFNEWKAKARHAQQDFRAVMTKEYGKTKLSPAENEVIDNALKGDSQALASLPRPVQDAVSKMRDLIDDLTQSMIAAGVVPQVQDIKDLIDDHIANSQAAGVEPNQKYLSMLRTKLAFAEKIENNIGSYVNRAYLKFRDKNWKEHVSQEKVNAAVHYIYNEALLQGKQMSEEQATDIINDILEAKTLDHVMTASKFAMNMGILKKMKEIPGPIRDLMGEVKEAEWNFMNTVTKMANLLERHKFLQSFHDAGLGSVFDRKRDPGKDFVVQLQQPTWGPLNGVWTTPELARALKEWDGDKVDTNIAWKYWRDVNNLAKSAKTTLSWVSELRNLMGNITLTMFNGNFNPMHFKKGMLAIADVFNKVQGDQARAYVEKLNRLRIIGTSLPYHEIRGMVNELTQSLPELNTDDPLLAHRIWNKVIAFKNRTGEVYGATDDIYKIMTWEMEKSRLAEAYRNSNVPKTEEEIEKEAAEITLRIMPTFSKVPKIVKTLSYNAPIIGTFISYPAELMRTTYNGIALSVEQMKSDNPEIRMMGAKRLAWQLGTISLPYVLAGLVGLLGTVAGYAVANQDEKDAIYDLLPDYYRNDNMIIWKKNGKYYAWMGSGWDGQSYLREIFNGAVRGGEMGDHHIGEAVRTAFGPFAQPAMPTQKIVQWVKNKDEFGRKIVYEQDDDHEKTYKFVKHFGDVVTPQVAKDVEKPIENFIKGDNAHGALGVLKFISGQTVMEIDPQQALNFKARDLEEEYKEINQKADYDVMHGKSGEQVSKWVEGKMQELSRKSERLDEIRKKLIH